MSTDAIVVFGVGSDATVEQWDARRAATGIMLRWFLPDLDFPAFGFDVYRATIPDIPPLPFDDINIAAVAGQPNWQYAGIVTLSCASGLRFEPSARAGWNRLIIAPNAPVRVQFSGPTWRFQVRAETVGAGIEVAALVDGAETLRETLDQPNAELLWRTRRVNEISLTGDGTVSFIGFHLLDDSRFWTQLAHRCLPVHDAAYPCAPAGAATEEDEAAMRLPADVAAEWKKRFSDPFKAMLPALHRLARGDAPAAIPPDSLDPRQPRIATTDSLQERALIKIALLDPHVARILGLAYDDPVALNGQEYAYKVSGVWRGAAHSIDGSHLSFADVMKLLTKGGARVKYTAAANTSTINFADGAVDFSLEIDANSTLEWTAEDDNGLKSQGRLDGKRRTVSLPRVVTLRLTWAAGNAPSIIGVNWYGIDRRTGVLPSVFAREFGPPAGPASIDAAVRLPASPSGIASAALDWPLPVASDGSTAEGGAIAYQVGRRLLGGSNLAAAPATGPAAAADVLRPFAPLYLSQQSISDPPPRTLHVDDNDGNGLPAGWWGWWVRGVDLFGRVSNASSWDVGKVDDVAPPPAPVLVQAEWVQRSLPEMTVAVLGRSVEASRWLAATAAQVPVLEACLVISWALPPEQAELRDDIDGFRLELRKAAAQPGAAVNAALVYPDWPALPIADFGPVQIVGRGRLVASTPNPTLAIDLSSGERVPEAPHAPTTPQTVRTAFRTNLTLDGASNVFVGGTVTIGARSLDVVANGDGPNLVLVVEHAVGAPPPAAAAATLRAAAGALISFQTDVPDLAGTAQLVARSGLLLDEQATPARYPVLRKNGTEFLCINPPIPDGVVPVAPVARNELAWHPVWFASLSDTGFGPMANAQTPVANAQVAVRSLRLIQSRALPSARSAPLTVTAVDVAAPATPNIAAIQFDPAANCAQIASRADWYGESRFTFSWTPQANCTFTVYRALADEVFRLDREHVRSPAPRDFAEKFWPAVVWADPARKARVENELAVLDAALEAANAASAAAASDAAAAKAVAQAAGAAAAAAKAAAKAAAAASDAADAADAAAAAAYNDLCCDTQMFLGLQPHAWPAFMPLFGRPIAETSYTDTLNGRTRAHWFYAVTARSRAGVESAPSTISPPICCPDVVPPAPPLAHSALAAEGAVKLKWLSSPDADTHHYEIYAAREADAVAHLDILTPLSSYAVVNGVPGAPEPNYTPAPHVSGKIIERFVSRALNEMGDWCFWIVAIDTSGNRSKPSNMLRGKALVPPPLPPVWVSAIRNAGKVELAWTYPSGATGYPEDQRWACLIERYSSNDERWSPVSKWLPRGIYLLIDEPPDLIAAWYYRIRIRDHEMRSALVMPEIFLDEGS